MDTFNIIAGLASIIGLGIAIFAVPKIIKKMTIKDNSKNNNNTQSLNIDGENSGNATQIVGDNNNVG